MECSCVVNVDCDGDSAEFASTRMVTAKKPHLCSECNKTIAPGEEYEYMCGKWDGDFETYKTCIDCASIRNAFFCTWCYGTVIEDLSTNFIEGCGFDVPSSECMSKLTPRALDMVCDLIEESWDYKEARMKRISDGSPALALQKATYPYKWQGKVPRKIVMTCTVQGDFNGELLGGEEYYAYVKADGALYGIDDCARIELKENQYRVVEWHKTKKEDSK